jgi:uncharacterized protein with GYD domain
MPTYLVQASYTAEAVAALIKSPQDRREVVRKMMKEFGGKLIGIWLAFGEHDIVGIFEVPDNTSAVAASMAIAASGTLKSVKTTPLVGFEDGVEAMKKAGNSGYKPVTAKS